MDTGTIPTPAADEETDTQREYIVGTGPTVTSYRSGEHGFKPDGLAPEAERQ